MQKVNATVSFLFVFAVVFILGGLFIQPILPPYFDRPVSMFEGQYWTTNWAGLILGIALGALAARSTLKKKYV